jgi:predicted amidohydrolase
MKNRRLTIGAAQVGPIHLKDSRASVVRRLIDLLRQAHAKGCRLVVFPELTLTTFFPRWWMESREEIESFFEKEMPGPDTAPLFDEAKKLGIGFYLGYAEIDRTSGSARYFNTSILTDASGGIVGKYRKVHLPGHSERKPEAPFQHLEKRYFEPGDLGFPVWQAFDSVVGMCICNDRRWPETYRVMGLQGAELIVLGYNTPSQNIFHDEPIHLRMFHNYLVMQAGAYQNASWVVAAAKCGREDGFHMIGGSCIIAPTGEIVARCTTEQDELISYDCDLDLGSYIKNSVFNFARHRRVEHYGLITNRTG